MTGIERLINIFNEAHRYQDPYHQLYGFLMSPDIFDVSIAEIKEGVTFMPINDISDGQWVQCNTALGPMMIIKSPKTEPAGIFACYKVKEPDPHV